MPKQVELEVESVPSTVKFSSLPIHAVPSLAGGGLLKLPLYTGIVDEHDSMPPTGPCSTLTRQVVATRGGRDSRVMCNTWPRSQSRGRCDQAMATADLFCSCRPASAQKRQLGTSASPQRLESNADRKSTAFASRVKTERQCRPVAEESRAGIRPYDNRHEELASRERALANERLWNNQLEENGKALKKADSDRSSTEALNTAGIRPVNCTVSSVSSDSIASIDDSDTLLSSERLLEPPPANNTPLVGSVPQIAITTELGEDAIAPSRSRPRSTSYHGRLGHKLGKLFSPSGKNRSHTLDVLELPSCESSPGERNLNSDVDEDDDDGDDDDGPSLSRHSRLLRQAVSAENLLRITTENDSMDSQGRKKSRNTSLGGMTAEHATAAGRSPQNLSAAKMLSTSSSDLRATTTVRKGKKPGLRALFAGHDVLRRSVTFHRRETKPKKSDGKDKKKEASSKLANSSLPEEPGSDGSSHEWAVVDKADGCHDSRSKPDSGSDLNDVRSAQPQAASASRIDNKAKSRLQQRDESADSEGYTTGNSSFGIDNASGSPDTQQFRKRAGRTVSDKGKVLLPICGKCVARRRAVFSLAWYRQWHEPSSPRPLMLGDNQPLTEETFTRLCTLLVDVPGSFSENSIHLVRHRRTGERFAMKQIPLSLDTTDNARHARVMHTSLNAVRAPFIANLFYSWLARPPFETTEAHVSITELCHGGTLQHYVSLRMTRLPESDVRFYAMQVILALHYLHSLDIILVDLSPRHILLTENGYLRICDVDSAVYLGDVDDGNWSINNMKATADHSYLAPELLSDEEKLVLHPGVDYWGLGLLIYAMANYGRTPFSVNGAEGSKKRSQPAVQVANSDNAADPSCPVTHPIWFTTSLSGLLNRLLQRSPAQRQVNLPSGLSSLFSHRWFTGKLPRWTGADSDQVFVDGNAPADSVIGTWRAVLLQQVRAPYIPELSPGLGIASQNFDKVIAPTE